MIPSRFCAHFLASKQSRCLRGRIASFAPQEPKECSDRRDHLLCPLVRMLPSRFCAHFLASKQSRCLRGRIASFAPQEPKECSDRRDHLLCTLRQKLLHNNRPLKLAVTVQFPIGTHKEHPWINSITT